VSQPPISVAALIAEANAEEHAARADRYFRGVDANHWSFRKPFAPLAHAGPALMRLGAMFDAADLYPGLRVLDFGCGVAWLGRLLAEAGCSVVAADVSPSVLEAAAAHDAQHHPGLAGRLRYQTTDGTRIDLPAGSIDRILSHEALHHLADPAPAIAEFRRLLAPGGRAVFMEPGPDHSLSATSQAEMAVHGVIENDVHVERIWEAAAQAGFHGIEIGLFGLRPEMLPLDRFLALWRHELRGGPAPELPAAATYRDLALPVLQGFRMFVLHADAAREAPADSLVAQGLSVSIEVAGVQRQGEQVSLDLVLRNTGTRAWRPSGTARGAVNLGAILLEPDGSVRNRNHRRHACVTERLPPGVAIETRFTLPVPPGAGLSLDMVAEHVCWFGQPGVGLEVALPG